MSDTTERSTAHHWDKRLTAIETGHLQLQGDVSALAKDVGALVSSTENVSASVRTIAENQNANARTNWNVVLTGAIVALMVLGLVVYEPLRNITSQHRGHISDGHPDSVLDKIEERTDVFRREIDRHRTKFLTVEERLDNMSTMQKSTEERLLGLERDIYTHTSYRSGRPISTKPPNETAHP